MSDKPNGEAVLTPDQRSAIDTAERWQTDALAGLGAAYLEYSELETLYLKAKIKLTSARAGALEAELRRGNMVAAIARDAELPPGEWTYNSKEGKLVRKDTQNAHSS